MDKKLLYILLFFISATPIAAQRVVKITYEIQIASAGGNPDITVEYLKKSVGITEPIKIHQIDNLYKFTIGEFDNMKDCRSFFKVVKSKYQLTDAFVKKFEVEIINQVSKVKEISLPSETEAIITKKDSANSLLVLDSAINNHDSLSVVNDSVSLTRDNLQSLEKISVAVTIDTNQYKKLKASADSAYSIGDLRLALHFVKQINQLMPNDAFNNKILEKLEKEVALANAANHKKWSEKLYKNYFSNNHLASIYFFVIFYLLITIVVLISLVFSAQYLQKYQKSRNHGVAHRIREILIDFVFNEQSTLEIPYALKRIKPGLKRNLLMKELASLQDSVIGEYSNKLMLLFKTLDLEKVVLKQLKRKNPYQKLQAIDLLIYMKVSDALPVIVKYLNHKNELIRNKVVEAVFLLDKDNPFKTIENFTKNMSEWNQLNIISLLSNHSHSSLPDFSQWLSSSNKSVIIFSLRMIRYFKQTNSIQKVVEKLNDSDAQIKHEAIVTLGCFQNSKVKTALQALLINGQNEFKLPLIRALSHSASSADIPFFEKLFSDTDFEIQKAAVDAIYSIGVTGKKFLRYYLTYGKVELIKPIIRSVLDKQTLHHIA